MNMFDFFVKFIIGLTTAIVLFCIGGMGAFFLNVLEKFGHFVAP